jgi:hypothetical protein
MKTKKFTKALGSATEFFLSKGWRKQLTMHENDVQFLAGLALLMLSGCGIKAGKGAILARPMPNFEDPDHKKLIAIMERFGGWEWDDGWFISYYPKG